MASISDMLTRDGFPKALVEFGKAVGIRKFFKLAEEAIDAYGPNVVMEYLLFYAPIGPLRTADPILADLVVVLRDTWVAVDNRLQTLGVKGMGEEQEDETNPQGDNDASEPTSS